MFFFLLEKGMPLKEFIYLETDGEYNLHHTLEFVQTPKILKECLRREFNVNFSLIEGGTYIMYLIDEGFFELARIILPRVRNFHSLDNRGENILTIVATVMTESEADIFAYILKKNVDLEIPDSDGRLPLIILLDRQEFTLAQMLVDKIKDDARHKNISKEELQAILSLKKYSQDVVFAHLEFFIRNGYTETFSNHENIPMKLRDNPDLQILYYELHPDEINWLNDNGRNILFYNPSEKLLYYLLQNGVDYNIVRRNGNNLYDTKYKYIILALIDLGMKPNNPERIEWEKISQSI